MKSNLNEFEDIILLAIKSKNIKFNCVRKDSRAKDNKNSIVLCPEEYINIVKL